MRNLLSLGAVAQRTGDRTSGKAHTACDATVWRRTAKWHGTCLN